jgi:hypothetical protein
MCALKGRVPVQPWTQIYGPSVLIESQEIDWIILYVIRVTRTRGGIILAQYAAIINRLLYPIA